MSDSYDDYLYDQFRKTYLQMLAEMLDSEVAYKYSEDGSIEGLTSNGSFIVKAYEEPLKRSQQKKPTKVNRRCQSKKS